VFEDFIASIDNIKDKNDMSRMLEKLVVIVEKSQNDYASIVEVVENIEISPFWVIQSSGEIFTQNKISAPLNGILKIIDFSKPQSEVSFNHKTYFVQVKQNNNKFTVTALDITKSKQEERLISMGKMASHLAHEIRNPIGSVSLLASTLVSLVSSEHTQIVTDIQKAIWRVERIIQATLLFGKDIPIIAFNEISLSDIKLGIEECLQYYSYDKDISLDISFEENIKVKVNLELLLVVFQNMIFNAIDAIEENEQSSSGVIEVRYLNNDMYHIFSFYDDGVPIKDKNMLFVPYASTKVKGNGLGLVLVQKIIKAHNGKIELSNKKKEFFIYIKKDI